MLYVEARLVLLGPVSTVLTRSLLYCETGACGAVQPCFTLIFGALVDTLGSGKSMSDVLRPSAFLGAYTRTDFSYTPCPPVILWFCYLGIGATACGYLKVACFEISGMVS